MSDLRMSSYNSQTTDSSDRTDSDDAVTLFGSSKHRKTLAERRYERRMNPKPLKPVRPGPRLREVTSESPSGSTYRSYTQVLDMRYVNGQREWIRTMERSLYWNPSGHVSSASEISYSSGDSYVTPIMRWRRRPKVTSRSLYFGMWGRKVIEKGREWFRHRDRRDE